MSLASVLSSSWSSILARRSLTALSCNGVFQAVPHPGPCLTNYQQNRFKQKKIRFKALKPAKEKKKHEPKSPLQTKKVVKRKINPEFEARYPTDNIWLHKHYPVQKLALEVAIMKHKAYADPMMLNNLDGLLYADMELNMETKKKTKFLSTVKGTVVFPHLFDDNTKTRCILFTKDIATVTEGLSAGATHAGGQELLDMIKSEALSRSMYDYVVCTPDIYSDLLSYRHIFKDKFPHQKQGTVGTDVKTIITSLMNGIQYECKKTSEEAAIMQVAFGKLNMETEDLVKNFLKLVDKLCVNRSPNLKPFITNVKIIAPPSEEVFHVQVQKYVPGYGVPEKKAEETSTTMKTKGMEDEEEEGRKDEKDEDSDDDNDDSKDRSTVN
ncbi:39S ribosomal protein L1, mitochondrial [Octopus bimaculoides]|uniref:39S ribosomal protein L1, mitochondrial n=1 Tax=Octopus bimaculoides TaxID=37653 RepID=A0A0L8H786_OCTBM|nr:39S ribosomal protein L1, mitochondrial [Octopus bimaculoides]|eukprot:XP_014774951.1 PREDICTED: 39S ribosomal protein L1, mitochondrial-like [Octopus bimaculoides]